MTSRAWMTLGATALLLLSSPVAGPAQEAPPAAPAAQPPAAEAPDAEPPVAEQEPDLLDDDALDDLVAPVALYPDALLSQVLMAATYPLEIVKAARFVTDNPAMTDEERAEAARQQDWDASVQVLAGGFPDIVARMADDLDWTEDLGDAMIAQTDDLLDAVQRMRAQAAAAGNLDSNEAQTVTAENDQITIVPADPERVYVPSYDPVAAYAPYVPVATDVDTGFDTGDVIMTGAVAFGTALLLDEVFDDDDDCCWHGDSIDWDDHEIHVDRDINRDINRDVDRTINRNIDRTGDRTIDRTGDRTGDRTIDRTGDGVAWKPTDRQRDAARERIDRKSVV